MVDPGGIMLTHDLVEQNIELKHRLDAAEQVVEAWKAYCYVLDGERWRVENAEIHVEQAVDEFEKAKLRRAADI